MPKGTLSEAERASLLDRTRDAAAVLLDDLQHMRGLVAMEEPSPGDLRRMSALLRRILIEGDLRKIAAPRVGRIAIRAPDMRVLHRANEERPFLLLAADTFHTHGIIASAMSFEEGAAARELRGFNPEDLVSLPLEPFQNQKVLCCRGKWATRADIIKYVANVGHGVHTGAAREDVELLIRKVRHSLTVTMEAIGPDGEQTPTIAFNADALGENDPPIEFRPNVVDLALLYLISTAQFLTSSPDVAELERVIGSAE